jgi:hypothetical protein
MKLTGNALYLDDDLDTQGSALIAMRYGLLVVSNLIEASAFNKRFEFRDFANLE